MKQVKQDFDLIIWYSTFYKNIGKQNETTFTLVFLSMFLCFPFDNQTNTNWLILIG
jgi:hypothetical protein